MESISLKNALALISSDKVKERTEGQSMIRSIFSIRENCENLADQADGNGWLHTFQTIFGAILVDRSASVKAGKSGSAASNAANSRLSRWAGLLRWLVRHSVRYITRKTVTAIFTHLTQSIIYRGSFLAPLALDYIKALKILISRQEHLDHLDESSWATLMTMCWNAALQLPLDSGTDGWGYEEDVQMELDELDSASASTTFLSLETIELLSLVPILLSSDAAPLLPHPIRLSTNADAGLSHRAGVPILRNMTTFLERYPTETSAHRSVLLGLNLLLAQLELNYTTEIRKAGIKLIPSLVSLWSGTKSLDTREQILMALNTLFPHITSTSGNASWSTTDLVILSEDVLEAIGRLAEMLSKEFWSGSRGTSLPMMRLKFQIDRNESNDGSKGKEKESLPRVIPPDEPFRTRIMRAGPAFSNNDAYIWSALELQADSLVQLHTSVEHLQTSGRISSRVTPGPTAPKRRKIEDPLVTTLSTSKSHRTSAGRLASLQALYFVIERHWQSLHRQLQHEICETMRDLMQLDTDPAVQQWSTLNLACALAEMDSSEAISASRVEQAWQASLRKISQDVVCRSAAHLVHLILTLGLVDHVQSLKAVHVLLRDIHLQGPSAVHDSVCALLTHCVSIAQGDIKLYNLNLEDNVATWFAQVWAVHAAGDATVDPWSVLQMLGGVSGRPVAESGTALAPFLQSSLAQSLRRRSDESKVGRFLLQADLKGVEKADVAASATPAQATTQIDERRIKVIAKGIHEALSSAAELLEGKDTSITPNRLRSIVDSTTVALLFAGLALVDNSYIDREDLQLASSIMLKAIQTMMLARWNAAERANLLRGLYALFFPEHAEEHVPEGALLPRGLRSGIATTQELSVSSKIPDGRGDGYRLLYLLWNSSELDEISQPLQTLFKVHIRNTVGLCRDEPHVVHDSNGASSQDDDFPMIITTDGDDMGADLLGASSHEANRACIDAFVDLAIACRSYHTKTPKQRPVKERELLNILLEEEDGHAFTSLATPLFRAVSNGRLEFNRQAAETFFEVLSEYMRSYKHSKSSDMYLLAMAFIETTYPLWEQDTETRERAKTLLSWLVKQMTEHRILAWRVRLRLLELLDVADASGLIEDVDDMLKASARLIEDPDIHVRFKLASSVARQFESLQDPIDFYSEIGSYLEVTPTAQNNGTSEYLLSRIVYLANVAIVSSTARRPALFHLYSIVAETPSFTNHIQAALDGIVRSLGVASLQELYMAYAARIIVSQETQGQDPLRLALSLYGFNSRRSYASTVLDRIGHVIFELRNDSLWRSLCDAAGRSSADCMNACAPAAIALRLACVADEIPTKDPSLDSNLQDTMRTLRLEIKHAGGDNHVADIANIPMDLLVGHLFLLIDETQTDEQCAQLLDKGTRTALTRLWPADEVSQLEETHAPKASFSAIMAALKWITNQRSDPGNRAQLAYHALQEISGRMSSVIILNERQRHRRNLCLLVAVFSDEFRGRPELLSALHRTAVALYGVPDLSGSVAPLVRWTFDQMIALKTAGDALAQELVRVGTLAYSLHDAVPGQRMLVWLESKLSSLAIGSNREALAAQTAAAMWPRALPESLKSSIGKAPTRKLVEMAENVKSPAVGKLELSRQLLETPFQNHLQHPVSERTFWALRSAMPAEPSIAESKSFVDLFYRTPWHLQAPDLSLIVDLSSSTSPPGLADPRTSLLAILMDSLDHARLDLRHLAYRTLCTLVHGDPAIRQGSGLSGSLKRELALVGTMGNLEGASVAANLSVLVNSPDWAALHHNDTKGWVTAFAPIVATAAGEKNSFYARLRTILEADPAIAECMLPALVHGVLGVGDEHAFARAILSTYLQQVLSSPQTPVTTLSAIIGIVLYLRTLQPPWSASRLAGDAWLDIDYVVLSHAALRSHAYATALKFLETARDVDSPGGASAEKDVDSHEVGELSEGAESSLTIENTEQQLLYAIYSHVGDPDGFYGIPPTTDIGEALVRRLHHEHQWNEAFAVHAANLESSRDAHQLAPIGHALQATGYNQLALTVLGRAPDKPLSMDLAWRTQSWDLPDHEDSDIHAVHVYKALRAVHRQRDRVVTVATIETCLSKAAAILGQAKLEDMEDVAAAWRQVLCLREVQNWYDVYQPLVDEGRWGDELWKGLVRAPAHLDYADAHLIMSIRKSLLSAANNATDTPIALGNMLSDQSRFLTGLSAECDLYVCYLARTSSRKSEALNAIASARRAASSLHEGLEQAVATEFAEVLWMQGEHALAIEQMRYIQTQLVKSLKGLRKEQQGQLGRVLGTLGDWLWAAKQAKAEAIEREYFQEAAVRMASAAVEEQARVFTRYARFADQLQRGLSTDAGDVAALRLAGEYRRGELNELRRRSDRTYDKHIRSLEIEQDDDDRRLKEITVSRLDYLTTACRMYAQALAIADTQDDAALRLCALWLEHNGEDDFNGKIQMDLMKVPSWKFGTLIRQLTARLQKDGVEQSPFQHNLEAVLVKLCHDHPFHILYSLLTIAYPLRKASRRQSALGNPREQAALDLITKVKAGSRAKLISQMDMFSNAAIAWAEVPMDKAQRQKDYAMPPTTPLALQKDLMIPIPTADLPYDRTTGYKDVVTIRGYEPKYSIAGGISRPKIMTCLGSDGSTHRELFKSRDDLRQDAVMEQVFAVVNQQLSRDETASQRKLRFRTYNVLPLANSNGIIEFVANTNAIGDWLLPAHLRYHPQDHKPMSIRDALRPIQESESLARNEVRRALERKLVEMRKNFKPVFRHFFTEQHTQPMAWFLMRLNYARSLAVTSIAGHLLGLGDRHCSNILIDRVSGELVHIDLGIAFDQGKLLHIPEHVPFRMTNDMVDGLGMSGTEGTFKRCAEHTLRVLRGASDVLMTVLECLKYDPLQDWVAAPARKQKAQGGPSNDPTATSTATPGSELADRALRGVAKKLSNDLSVEYTVNELMREAMDPYNLASIFTGWQPWL